MKNLKMLAAAVLFLIPGLINAQSVGKATYNLLPESKLWFDGTSTIHDFTCNAKTVKAEFTAASEFESFISNPNKETFNIKVTIPVKSISSGKESMDENMMESFRADKYPNITYEINKAVSKSAPELGEGWYKLETKGYLTISGVKRLIDMTVNVQKDKAGKIKFKGTKELKMTDFGIKPPTMMLGTVKTGDNITINFDLTFKN